MNRLELFELDRCAISSSEEIALCEYFKDISSEACVLCIVRTIYPPYPFGMDCEQELEQEDFGEKKILDIFSGSGVIGLGLAKKFPNAVITCSDINDKAVSMIHANATINCLSNVDVVCSDVYKNINDVYDCIIATPPILSSKQVTQRFPDLPEDERLMYEAGATANCLINKVLKESSKYLTDDGALYIPVGKGSKVKDWVKAFSESWEIQELPASDAACICSILKLKKRSQ